MKVFICSEMKEPLDIERRRAAQAEIQGIGHLPICFEDLPSRKIPDDKKTLAVCLELVRESDLCLVIVDNTVTKIMDAEIREAKNCLGEDRVVFYFTKNGKRDQKAAALWDSIKGGWIVKQIEDSNELAREIARSIASYAGDAIKGSTKKARTLEELIELRSHRTWEKRLALKKGEEVTITSKSLLAFFKFKAGFYSRGEYFKRKPTDILKEFNFGRQTAKPHFTYKGRIADDDDYYFFIKADPYPAGIALITVEMKIE